MRPASVRPYRCLAVGLLLYPLLACTAALRAQSAPLPPSLPPAAQAPQPSVDDLERRVADLEAVIRQMQTDRQAPAAGPVASLQGVTPDATTGGEPGQQAPVGAYRSRTHVQPPWWQEPKPTRTSIVMRRDVVCHGLPGSPPRAVLPLRSGAPRFVLEQRNTAQRDNS